MLKTTETHNTPYYYYICPHCHKEVEVDKTDNGEGKCQYLFTCITPNCGYVYLRIIINYDRVDVVLPLKERNIFQ